jgi:hypothetical protein
MLGTWLGHGWDMAFALALSLILLPSRLIPRTALLFCVLWKHQQSILHHDQLGFD